MQELAKILGQNLKNYRIKFGYTQDHVASYLGVDRSAVSYYENAEREISMVHLLKLTDLYGVELDALTLSDPEQVNTTMAFAFRSEQNLAQEDIDSIAAFQKVVKNYIQMRKLSDEKE